ncbi:MAG: hypothetical protein WC759_03505, partial [Candidatus Micrarchaeia archaeon]
MGNSLTPGAASERSKGILWRLELPIREQEREQLKAEFNVLYVDTFAGHHSARTNGRKGDLPEWKDAQQDVRAAAKKIDVIAPSPEATLRHINELSLLIKEQESRQHYDDAFRLLHKEYKMLLSGIAQEMKQDAGAWREAWESVRELSTQLHGVGKKLGYFTEG